MISTDKVQAVFFSTVFLLCFSFVLYKESSMLSFPVPQLENFSEVSSKLCGWLFMPLLAMLIEQSMGQRCFAGASAKIVSRAAFFAGIVAMVVCFCSGFPWFIGQYDRTGNANGRQCIDGGHSKNDNPVDNGICRMCHFGSHYFYCHVDDQCYQLEYI